MLLLKKITCKKQNSVVLHLFLFCRWFCFGIVVENTETSKKHKKRILLAFAVTSLPFCTKLALIKKIEACQVCKPSCASISKTNTVKWYQNYFTVFCYEFTFRILNFVRFLYINPIIDAIAIAKSNAAKLWCTKWLLLICKNICKK